MRPMTFKRARPRPPVPNGYSVSNEALAALLGYASPSTRPATVSNVFGLPVAGHIVSKIAGSVASMMRDGSVYGLDGRTQLEPPAILTRPNLNYGATEFWREIVTGALLDGNAIAIKADYDLNGFPRQLVPMPIEACTAHVEDGRVFYEIEGNEFDPSELVHVRWGLTRPGVPFALGRVQAARTTFEGMLASESMAKSTYTDSAIPSGIINVDSDVPTAEERSYVEDRWSERYGGGRSTPAVMGSRMTFTPVAWKPVDAQFIESRKLSDAHVALLFGMRPVDVDTTLGASSTYGNRTDDALQRIVDAYQPLADVLEDAWSDLLPEGQRVRSSAEALLRGSTRERYELHGLAQSIGLETQDETRDLEGKRPMAEPKETPDEA